MGEMAIDPATSFRVGSSIALPAVITTLGQSPHAVFEAAGVDPELYQNPENRIAAIDLGRLFHCAALATGRQDIGLLATSGFRPQGLGLVGLLAAEGPDVNTALRNLVRMLRYNTLAGYPVLTSSNLVAMMKFDLRYADFVGAEFILEGATTIILRFLQWICGRNWKPEEVHLSRREPVKPWPFRDFFGAPVRFSATEDGVLFSSNWLSRPVDREEPRLRSKELNVGRDSFSELIRRQVAIGMGFEPLTGESLATRLGISRRQLFRQLRAENTTCQKLVDDGKFSRARYLLTAGEAPIAEIAYAVGYADQSSFTRAFTRWAGKAPGEYRRNRRFST
jgi:AraC-like DNA-binding protein